MSEAAPRYEHFPRPLLYAIGAILAVTVISAAVIRTENIGETFVTNAAAIVQLPLRFEDRTDGGIDVIDARDGHVVHGVAPGTNGFLRGALRGLARDRKRRGISAEPPFILAARVDGRLTLDDSATGRQIDLASFGPTNAATFRQFLPRPETSATAVVASTAASTVGTH